MWYSLLVSGKCTEKRLVQKENAPSPMVWSEFGRWIDVRAVHLEKAYSSMVTSPDCWIDFGDNGDDDDDDV